MTQHARRLTDLLDSFKACAVHHLVVFLWCSLVTQVSCLVLAVLGRLGFMLWRLMHVLTSQHLSTTKAPCHVALRTTLPSPEPQHSNHV